MATLSAAAIAGIVTAVVVTCVVLIILGYILRSRRRRGRNTVIPYGATPFAPTPFAARPVAATPLTVPSPHVPRFWTGLPQTEGPTFSFGETWSETSVGPRQIFELPGDLPIKDGSNDPWAGWRARNVPRYPVQEFPVPFPEGYPGKLWELPADETVPHSITDTSFSAVNNVGSHYSSGGVNPRDVEYEPNPVIFPHLKDASRSYMVPWGADEKDGDVDPRSAGVVQLTSEANISSLDAEQSDGFALSESPQPPATHDNEQGPRALIAAILSGRSLGPPRQQHTAEEARLTAASAIPSPPSLPESSSSTAVDADSVALNLSTPATSLSSPAPPQQSSPSDTTQPNACSDCDSTFRTPGQLREHRNRKHVRRYICTICTRDFHLQADLKRHEKTVHSTPMQSNASVLRCTNSGCKTPSKEWDPIRRDNFQRHVKRCRKASAREGNEKKDGGHGDNLTTT